MATEGRSSLKVLAVIDSLDPGGAERSLVDALAVMSKHVEPHIAVFRRSANGFESAATDAGIELHDVEGRFPQRIRHLRSLVSDLAPDVVHSSLWNADLVARAALMGTDVPLVCSLVNDTYDPERSRQYSTTRRALLRAIRILDRATSRRVDRFHAVTESVKAHHVRQLGLDPRRVTVARRGRSTSVFRPASASERTAARATLGVRGNIVVGLGRLEPQKSFSTLVEAIAIVTKSKRTTMCLLVGRDGNDGDRVRCRIDALGLGDRVRWLGPRSDIDVVLAAADCLVLPSQYEGTAGVVIEAMLAGVPVVASALPGIREVTDGGRVARLVTPGDSTELAEAIVATLNEGRHGVAAAARRHAEASFSIEVASAALLDIYRAAGAERHRQ